MGVGGNLKPESLGWWFDVYFFFGLVFQLKFLGGTPPPPLCVCVQVLFEPSDAVRAVYNDADVCISPADISNIGVMYSLLDVY